MGKIRILPEILASQVAAGEVVERPASAVKELVENSLDAGAKEVRVEIRRGGASLLKVTDDGCGMSKDDALMSLERHATSKLRDLRGLAEIRTLGFRGEAVPSIASVSRFRMVTCEAGAVAGTEVWVEGGVLREVREAGSAQGTVVEVKDLFFNVPARRKFMRAEGTEAAHIEHQLRLHALASPGVRFRFRRDDREVFDWAVGASRLDRVREMLGLELGSELIELPEVRGNGFLVSGFALGPRHARKGRKHQCVFLNGRPVEDTVISRGLAEGFRGGLPEGMHPAAWVWIEMEPGLVDVNVHPAKREIRLRRPHELREGLAECVKEGLAAEEKRRYAPPPNRPEAGRREEARPVGRPLESRREPAASVERKMPAAEKVDPGNSPVASREVPEPVKGAAWATAAVQTEWKQEEWAAKADPEAERNEGRRMPEFRWIGMVGGRYGLWESEGGLVVMDPRAVRERIHYERILEGMAEEPPMQPLLLPLLLEPGVREAEAAMRFREWFVKAGLELEDFGGGTLRISAAPVWLEEKHLRQLVLQIIDDLVEDGLPAKLPVKESFAKLLAKRAAMLESFRAEDSEALLRSLFECKLPYCAPDGRATLTEYSLRDLEKRFGAGR